MTLINFKTGYPLKKGEKSNGGGVEMGGGQLPWLCNVLFLTSN